MSIFIEAGSGGVRGRGCGLAMSFRPLITDFHVGDVVYKIDKARRGVLEKVVIKSIRPLTARRTLVAGKALYVDTLNGLWNEWDLVSYGEAVALVASYQQKLADAASRLPSC